MYMVSMPLALRLLRPHRLEDVLLIALLQQAIYIIVDVLLAHELPNIKRVPSTE